MNYIKELNAFRDWMLINQPSTGQIALWYALMSVNNMTGWKEWFHVPNQTLQLMTGLSRQGLDKARSSLIEMGLIQYEKGTSNQAGRYKMISLFSTECQKVGTGVVTEVVTPVDTEVGTEGASQLSQQERRGSTLFKLNKTKQDDWLDDIDPNPVDEDPEIKQVRELFIRRSERFPGGEDLRLMSEIVADGIPLQTILDGINYAFDSYKPKFKGDGITRFSYCSKVIRGQHYQKQQWLLAKQEKGGNSHAKSREEHRQHPTENPKQSVTGGKVGWLNRPKFATKQAKV